MSSYLNKSNFTLELTFNDAIKFMDLPLVKKCLSAGVVVTSGSIHVFINHIWHGYFDKIKYEQYESDKEILFELLLQHAFVLIVTDMYVMEKIIAKINYMELIIKYGYNDSYTGSVEIFKKI